MSTINSSASATAGTATNLGAGVTSALGTADSAATQRVQNLSMVHQARVAQLTRTASRAAAQYGANSTQAKAAAATVLAATATSSRVAMVSQQVTTQPPQVTATGWALYGRVFNAQLAPVAGYTVFLVDSQNLYQSAYGFAYTDTTGYFLLSFAGTPAASRSRRPPRENEEREAREAEESGTSRASASAQTAVQLFVSIADTKAQPVYRAATSFQPVVGQATYQNITLPAAGAPIGDPPAAIRQTGLPPTVAGNG